MVHARPGSDLTPIHEWHGNRLVKRFQDLRVDVVESCSLEETSDMLAVYQAYDEVEAVEPDYLVRADAVPDDPAYIAGLLWPLNNVGQQGGLPGADVQAAAAWDTLRSASNVIVAVIDSGVRYTHEDLGGNIWRNPAEIASNGVDDDHNGYVDDVHGINAITGSGDPMDDCGHGTHVAGIIGALGNNAIGTVGVAWQVQILPLKFMAADGQGSYSDAIECIEYACKSGAKIINASWGGPNYSAALHKALNVARAAGIIIVTAAGNQAEDSDLHPFYPGSFGLDNIVTVAATDRRDAFADSYSNYGLKSVQVAAPGTQIFSTWNSSDHSYITLSGTSMAAPCVAGALALMCARFPAEAYPQLIARLIASCDPLPDLANKCVSGGRVNLRRALAPSLSGTRTELDTKITVAAGRIPGSLLFEVQGPPNRSCAIEVSNSVGRWAPVLTNTLWSDGTLFFRDPSPRTYYERYFRARLLPIPISGERQSSITIDSTH
jgi:subtilisin family serine protease